jgi:hypothetical protein
VPRSTFYEMIEKGTIKKHIQPGRRDAYYLKAAIDDLVKARELFILEYATDQTTFEKAQEEDIQGIRDVELSLWGTRGGTPYERRLARHRKNPDMHYVLKYLDTVVGYIGLTPITKRAHDEIMATGKRGHNSPITLDDILLFTPNTTIEYLVVEIVVRDGVPKPKYYAMHLISGMMRILEDYAKQGTIVKKLFATSRTPDGIALSRKIGFKETPLPSELYPLFAFELDLETTTHPLARRYQEIVIRQHKHNGQNQKAVKPQKP